MSPQQLRQWIEEHDRTVSGLARELHLGRATLARYLNGTTPIPHVVELALEALEKREAAEG